MKTITLKFSYPGGAVSLAHPQAEPGISGNVSFYRIVNVPDAAQAAAVIALFNQTIIPFPDKLPVPYTVVYNQLGGGNVIMKRVLVRADQLPAGATFSSPTYPGIGTRFCDRSWKRQVGGETTVIIDSGVGTIPVELSPSDVLELVQGGEA